MSTVNVINTTSGERVAVPEDKLALAESMGFRKETPEEAYAQTVEAGLEQEYGDGLVNNALAVAQGAASGATFGLSDVLFGDDAAYQQIAERNPLARTVGEVASFVAPLGAIGKVTAAGVASQAAKNVADRIVAETAGKRIVKAGVESAIEGGIFGVGQAVSAAALGDDPLTAESVLAHVGSGAILGFGVGAALKGVGELGTAMTAKAARKAAEESQAAVLLGKSQASKEFGAEFTKTLRRIDEDMRTALDDYGGNVAAKATQEGLEAADAKLLAKVNKQAIKDELKLAKRDLEDNLFLGKGGIDFNKILSQSDESAQKAVKSLSNYAETLAKVDDRLGTDFSRKLATPEAFLDAMAGSVAPATKDSIRRVSGMLDTAAAADMLGWDVKKIPVIGGAADMFLKVYAAGRVLSSGAGQKLTAPLTSRLGVAGKAANSIVDSISNPGGAIMRTAAGVGQVQARISQAVTKIAEQAGRPSVRRAIQIPSMKIVNSVRYHDEDTSHSSPAAKRAAEVRMAMRSPEAVKTKIYESLAPIRAHNPNLASRIAEVQVRKMEYLASKLPPEPKQKIGTVHTEKFSRTFTEDFAKIVRAVEDPAAVIEDVAEGRVSPESVDALKNVYPELYQHVRVSLMDASAEIKQSWPYSVRLQVSMFYQVPLDDSLEPRNFQYLQVMNNSEAQPQQGGQVSGTPKPPTPTKGQRLMER